MRGRLRDFAGARFNHLVGLRVVSTDQNGTKWWWKCDCGTEIVRYANNVSRGSPKSCGCVKTKNPAGQGAASDSKTGRLLTTLATCPWLGVAAPSAIPASGRGRVYLEGRADGISIKDELERDFEEVALGLQEYREIPED